MTEPERPRRWLQRAGDRKTTIAAGLAAALVGASAVVLLSSYGGPLAGPLHGVSEKARVEGIVHDYILEHPEIIPEAVNILQDRRTAAAIKLNRADIETPFAGAWAGAQKPDVVLVEFFDYACPYCKASNGDVARLLREDPKLRVVWRDLPVLGPDSVDAARVSLAAAKQGRFIPFHDGLYAAGKPSPETIRAAQQAAVVTPLKSPDLDQELEKNLQLARILGATGTPTFVVGDKMLQGAVGYAALKSAIENARAGG